MSDYQNIVKANKEHIIVDCYHIINDGTLIQSYAIYTNLHVDRGIVPDSLCHWRGISKRMFRLKVNEFKRITGKRCKLYKTVNSLGYTRLVYRLV
jgi:hypothetical protein